MSYDAVSFLDSLFAGRSGSDVPVIVHGDTPPPIPSEEDEGPDDPILIHAEVKGDELRLHCPSPEVAEAVEAGRDELEAAFKVITAASEANDWPGDAVDAGDPCPRCGSLDKWWDLWDGEHCCRCEPTNVYRSQQLAARARLKKASRARDRPDNCQQLVHRTEQVVEYDPPLGPPATLEERLEGLTDEERVYYNECVTKRRELGEPEPGLPWRALVDTRIRFGHWERAREVMESVYGQREGLFAE